MGKTNSKELIIGDLIAEFDLNILNADISSGKRTVKYASISRAGLELTGLFTSKFVEHQIIGWGTKENIWFKEIGEEKAIAAIKRVLTEETPLLLLSSGFKIEDNKFLLDVANEFKIPVAQMKGSISSMMSTLGNHLGTMFSKAAQVHGSLVVINGIGVMIVGESGIGKSEAVIELIQNGHSFVTDDTVILKRVGNVFHGTGPYLTRGILEARGMGLIDIEKIYGTKTMREQSQVDFVVELLKPNKNVEFDRLGGKMQRYDVLNSYIPKIQLPVTDGRSLGALIESASNVYYAHKHGSDILEMIRKRGEDEQ